MQQLKVQAHCRAHVSAGKHGTRRLSAARCAVQSRASSKETANPSMQQAIAAASLAMMTLASPAHAEKIGEFAGSGFLFKDNVEVYAIDDADVGGVTLYLSEFQRNLADKLKKDFFSDPSQASLTCAVTGPVTIKDEKRVLEGSEVFSEKKSLNIFQDKTLRIRRLYDPKRNTLLYVAYSTRLSTASDDGGVTAGRYRTSICALKIPDAPAPPPVVAASEIIPASP